jgi:hypothetical protein
MSTSGSFRKGSADVSPAWQERLAPAGEPYEGVAAGTMPTPQRPAAPKVWALDRRAGETPAPPRAGRLAPYVVQT